MRYVEVSPVGAFLRAGPVPELTNGAARVRVVACGICGTDVHMLHGMRLPRGLAYPLRPGHEVAGIVTDLADGAGGAGEVSVGDLVVLHPVDPCGACPGCARGEEQLCDNAKVLGMHTAGGLAEEVVWPAARMVSASGLPPPVAAILADAGATAHRAVRAANLHQGNSLCVIGAGGVGTQVLKIARASQPSLRLAAVVGSQASAERLRPLDVHVEVGVAGVARRLRDALGEFDAVIDFSSQAAAPAEGVRLLRRGGRLVLGSVVDESLVLGSAVILQTRELEVVGVFGSTMADLRAVIAMSLTGEIDLSDAVTHRMPFSHAVQALHTVEHRPAGLVRMVVEAD